MRFKVESWGKTHICRGADALSVHDAFSALSLGLLNYLSDAIKK